MPFAKGNNANPGGKPKTKVLDDALRYILSQPLPKVGKSGKYNQIGLPKRPTVAQGAARSIAQSLIEGDAANFFKTYDRLHGVVVKADDEGSMNEPPPPVKSEDVTLKELARVIGSILIQAQPKVSQVKLLANDKR